MRRACLGFVLAAACWSAGALSPARSAEEALDRWLVTKGGFLGGEIRTPEGKPRGVYATRDYEDDEVMGFFPFSSTVPVARSSEAGISNLSQLAFDPASPYHVNGSYAAFWASQPGPGEMLSLDSLSPQLTALLEEPRVQAYIENSHSGHAHEYASLHEPPFTLAQYEWLAEIVTTRAFAFYSEDGSCCDTLLLPGFDLLNCHSGFNAKRLHSIEGSWRVELRAVGTVRAGDELIWDYFTTQTPRNDLTFLQYGFLNESDSRLLGWDRADFDGERPLAELPEEDEEPANMGAAAAAAELARVQAILDGLAPLAGDEARLAEAAAAAPWAPETMVYRLRVLRKRALTRRVRELTERLADAGEL